MGSEDGYKRQVPVQMEVERLVVLVDQVTLLPVAAVAVDTLAAVAVVPLEVYNFHLLALALVAVEEVVISQG